ncbi:MAG: helix-turn-helix domain-containing protein [Oligoflexales bacterium]|nr:helix-turn-helix domain-containing protein [Oligoflexales bacterium]
MMKADLQKQKKKRIRRSPEMIAELIFEAERKGNTAELCRKEGIAPNLFYRRKARFRQAGIEELKQMKRGRKSGSGIAQEKMDLQAENDFGN